MTELFDVLGLDASDSVVRAVAFALPIAALLTLLFLLLVMAKRKAKRKRAQETAPEQSAQAVARQAVVAHADVGDMPAGKPCGSAPEAVSPARAEDSAAAQPLPIGALQHAPAMPLQSAVQPPMPRDIVSVFATAAARAPAQVLQSSPAPAVPAAASASSRDVPLVRPVERGVGAQAPAAGEVLPSQAANAATSSMAVNSIEEQIKAAHAAEQKTALAPLFLQLAVAYRAAGSDGDCLNALRSAAGYGALHGPKGAHAIARMELGEIALRNGDPIGACEQWQIARLAFHDDGQKDAYGRVDKRMRDNGCPTDWVLTDF